MNQIPPPVPPPQGATPPPVYQPGPTQNKANPGLIVVAVIVGLFVICGVFGALFNSSDEEQPSASSESSFASREERLRELADQCLAMDLASDDDIFDIDELRERKRSVDSVLTQAEQVPGVVTEEEQATLNELLPTLEEMITDLEEEAAKARADEEKRRDGRIKTLKARTRQKYDEFEEYTWYEHVNEPRYLNTRSYVAVYFLVDKDGVARNLRIKNVYTADDWLFIETYLIKVDDRSYTIDKGSYGVDRDNNTDIWEWYDDSVDSQTLAMLKGISTSKSAKIRYQGQQYRKDRTIGANEKKAIAEMLELYELLSENK